MTFLLSIKATSCCVILHLRHVQSVMKGLSASSKMMPPWHTKRSSRLDYMQGRLVDKDFERQIQPKSHWNCTKSNTQPTFRLVSCWMHIAGAGKCVPDLWTSCRSGTCCQRGLALFCLLQLCKKNSPWDHCNCDRYDKHLCKINVICLVGLTPWPGRTTCQESDI